MPMKKRLAKGRAHRLTAEAVDAFLARDVLRLHAALGLRPWQPSPLEADAPEPPAWALSGTAWARAWPVARDLRVKLEGATG
jgi:hypothetical protein